MASMYPASNVYPMKHSHTASLDFHDVVYRSESLQSSNKQGARPHIELHTQSLSQP